MKHTGGHPILCCRWAEAGLQVKYYASMNSNSLRALQWWSMNRIVGTLCNRRYTEKTVAYSESHDQSIVGGACCAVG